MLLLDVIVSCRRAAVLQEIVNLKALETLHAWLKLAVDDKSNDAPIIHILQARMCFERY